MQCYASLVALECWCEEWNLRKQAESISVVLFALSVCDDALVHSRHFRLVERLSHRQV